MENKRSKKKIQQQEKHVEYQGKDTKKYPGRITELQKWYSRNMKHEEVSLDRREKINNKN